MSISREKKFDLLKTLQNDYLHEILNVISENMKENRDHFNFLDATYDLRFLYDELSELETIKNVSDKKEYIQESIEIYTYSIAKGLELANKKNYENFIKKAAKKWGLNQCQVILNALLTSAEYPTPNLFELIPESNNQDLEYYIFGFDIFLHAPSEKNPVCQNIRHLLIDTYNANLHESRKKNYEKLLNNTIKDCYNTYKKSFNYSLLMLNDSYLHQFKNNLTGFFKNEDIKPIFSPIFKTTMCEFFEKEAAKGTIFPPTLPEFSQIIQPYVDKYKNSHSYFLSKAFPEDNIPVGELLPPIQSLWDILKKWEKEHTLSVEEIEMLKSWKTLLTPGNFPEIVCLKSFKDQVDDTLKQIDVLRKKKENEIKLKDHLSPQKEELLPGFSGRILRFSLFRYLDTNDAAELAKHPQFSEIPEYKKARLWKAVIDSDLKLTINILNKRPDWLMEYNTVKDLAGRTIIQATPLQLAFGAENPEMCKAIMPYFKGKEHAFNHQIHERFHNAPDNYFDFNPLLNAFNWNHQLIERELIRLREYYKPKENYRGRHFPGTVILEQVYRIFNTNYMRWSNQLCNLYVCEVIAFIQALLPTHFVKKLCRGLCNEDDATKEYLSLPLKTQLTSNNGIYFYDALLGFNAYMTSDGRVSKYSFESIQDISNSHHYYYTFANNMLTGLEELRKLLDEQKSTHSEERYRKSR
jgi:hypothetical protein